jgi:hypothetical protein
LWPREPEHQQIGVRAVSDQYVGGVAVQYYGAGGHARLGKLGLHEASAPHDQLLGRRLDQSDPEMVPVHGVDRVECGVAQSSLLRRDL